MKKKLLLVALMAFSLALGACSAPQTLQNEEPLTTVPVELGEEKPEEETPSLAPASSEVANNGEEGSQPLAPTPQQGVTAVVADSAHPLKDQGASLVEWQWIDKNRLAILTAHTDTPQMLQASIFDRRDYQVTSVAALPGKAEDVKTTFLEDFAVFSAGAKTLSIARPAGVLFILSDTVPQVALPAPDAEYTYQNPIFSADGSSYFYQRYPVGVQVAGLPASDRIVVDKLGEADAHPVSQIVFPFDIRTSQKTARWLNNNGRILVQADVPAQDKYSDPVRTYYVFSAADGSVQEQFTMGENDLELLDTFKTKILFARPGEPYEVMCYDYKEKTTVSVVRLDGQNREVCTAKFSPDGTEMAVVRTKTDLTPAYYAIPQAQ